MRATVSLRDDQIAEVSSTASSPSRVAKTFELVAVTGPAPKDFEALFTLLVRTAQRHWMDDMANMPLDDEPQRVRDDLNAIPRAPSASPSPLRAEEDSHASDSHLPRRRSSDRNIPGAATVHPTDAALRMTARLHLWSDLSPYNEFEAHTSTPPYEPLGDRCLHTIGVDILTHHPQRRGQ